MIEISRIDEPKKRKLSTYKCCRDCKWLSTERCTVGRLCVHPNKEFLTKVSMWKNPANKACKLFGDKVVSE